MAMIDEYSTASVPISMAFGNLILSWGTSFVWQEGEAYFLVTNWHNVSGRNPHTGKHLSDTAAEPDFIDALFFVRGKLNGKFPFRLSLYDEAGKPRWREHPRHGRGVDIAAIPLPPNLVETADLHPINRMASEEDMPVQIGADVFVLGYPVGPKLALTPPVLPSLILFPVWKRGTIASEPQLVDERQRHFLIDTASRPGMSGSPVILRNSSGLVGGTLRIGVRPATRFVGIYSGRLAVEDRLDAQLGICWSADAVQETVRGAAVSTDRGTSSAA